MVGRKAVNAPFFEPTTDALKKVECRLVLFASYKPNINPREPLFCCDLSQPRNHPMFHLPAQHTAAQQQRVHEQGVRRDREDHYADKSIVSKPVCDSYREAMQSVAANLFDLGFRTPDGRAVELVGALGKLRNPGQLLRPYR